VSEELELGDDAALEQLAVVMRRITSVVVGKPVAWQLLAEATTTLQGVADILEGAAENLKRPRRQPTPTSAAAELFPTSPIVGPANPIAPPARIWTEKGEDGQPELRGQVSFDYQYEGPPTCVHGGVIAELFDELLGAANIVADKAGMTGTLTVKYRRPTPLLTELNLVARHTGSERRKSFAWAGIYHDGVLTAEAEGIFIAMSPGSMLDIVNTNARQSSAPVIDEGFIDLISENVVD
jgi:acyl-coenzyme A thioesterase PaaI-like protein